MANMSPVTMSALSFGPRLLCAACSWNVVHRNAPGAMNAIAFTVTPVSVNVRLI